MFYTVDDYLNGTLEPGQSLLCPFHPDHQPSARIMPDSGRFWCFVCRWGGSRTDVARRLWFDDLPTASGAAMASAFLERIARSPAQRVSVPRAQHARREITDDPAARRVMITLHRYAVAELEQHPAVIRELQRTRGLADPIQLGTGLATHRVFHLTLRDHPETALLERAGVCYPDGWFRLSNRLILPVFDEHGGLASYQARHLNQAHPVRYLNIPRWPKLPAGLHTLERPGPLCIVEGWFDAAPLWEAGLAALAAGGLSLRREILERIAPHLKERTVIIIFDNDQQAVTKHNVEAAAASLTEALAPLTAHVEMVTPPVKDVSAWSVEAGRDRVVIELYRRIGWLR
jgi:DNA primase